MDTLFHRIACLLEQHSPTLLSAEDALKSLGAPSVSFAVLHHGQIASYCFSALGHNADTVFQACSISKPLTAMIAARLVDQNVLSWDLKLLHVLPSHLFQAMGPESLLREITIKQLLSHTSGLDIPGFPGYRPSAYGSALPSFDNIIGWEQGSNTMGLAPESQPVLGVRFRRQ